MKLYIPIIIVFLGLFPHIMGQRVGIKTTNPLGILHIDGAQDNATTPTVAQQANDVIITSAGYMGIGTTSPSQKLTVNGTLRIVDGNQAAGYNLVSDAIGMGTWTNLKDRIIVTGTINTAVTNISTTYANVTTTPIELKPGVWMIVGKISISGTVSDASADYVDYGWVKIVEQNGTTYTDIAEGGNSHSIKTTVYSTRHAIPMVQAFVTIPTPTTSTVTNRKYYLYAKAPATANFSSPKLQAVGAPHYFYAIKLQ